MKIGKYSVKLNYGILKGFIDVIGLMLAYLIFQTTCTFVDQNIHPDMVLNNIYPGGVPPERWVPGFLFPFVGLAVVVFSVVFMFIRHKEPKKFIITEDNAQKYYDTIMIANSLLRILALLAIWDYTYIHQANLLFGSVSWVSLQLFLDILVAGLIIYIINERIKAFAERRTEKTQTKAEAASSRKAPEMISDAEKITAEEESENAAVRIKRKSKNDDSTIMRG